MNSTVAVIKENIEVFIRSLDSFVELIGCPSMYPIFRRLFFGPSCTDLARGLSWMYSTMLAITIFGLVVLSSRAAFCTPTTRRGYTYCRGPNVDNDSTGSNPHLDRAQSEYDSPGSHTLIHSSTNIQSIVYGVISSFSNNIFHRGYAKASCLQSTNHLSTSEAKTNTDPTLEPFPVCIGLPSRIDYDIEEIEKQPIGSIL